MQMKKRETDTNINQNTNDENMCGRTEMKKQEFIMILVLLLMLMTSCASDGLQEENSGNIINTGDHVSENQIDSLLGEQPESQTEDIQGVQINTSFDDQTEGREIVCENPYFFPQNTSLMTSEIFCIKNDTTITNYTYWFKSNFKVELELHWLKQYDNGCLARLSIVPFSYNMPDYMDETRMNIYFYVTSDKIYRISYPDLQNIGSFDADMNDDILLMSVLDTDEKLIENGELVCCLEGVEDTLEEGEAGTHTSVDLQGNQISYNRVDIEENGNRDYYENFIWEEGKGLVGYMSGYDAEDIKDTRLVYLEDILYGTTDQTEDRKIVCENPYFFPQNVSLLKADITYNDFFITIEDELELHWLKQYDNGCLARLSVVPFDYDEYAAAYLWIGDFEMYFYVTPDEIYRVDFYVSFADGSLKNRDTYIDYNDHLIMTVLNTDERLMEYGELVCSLERILNEVEEDEAGTYLSMRQEGEQVIYDRADSTEYNLNDWVHYYWENGQGLVGYRKGFRAERDPFYIENISVE